VAKKIAMKRLVLIAAVFAALTFVPAADAHLLTKNDAKLYGSLAMSDRADDICAEKLWCDFASYPRMSSRRDCFRYSRHTVVCVGSFTLYADFDSYYSDAYCVAKVEVRYRTRYSIAPRTRVYGVDCI